MLGNVVVPKTHNLKTLFFKLSVKDRQILGIRWRKERAEHKRKQSELGNNITTDSLARALEQSAYAFEGFRYYSEQPSFWSLYLFPWQLQELILEKRPEWATWDPRYAASVDPDADSSPEAMARILQEVNRRFK